MALNHYIKSNNVSYVLQITVEDNISTYGKKDILRNIINIVIIA